MTLANLPFVPLVLTLFVFFATNYCYGEGGGSTFVSLINLASLYSTERIAKSFEGIGLE